MSKFRILNKVGNVKIVPIGLKILLVFICVILLATFSTNFITVTLSQRQILKANNTIMVQQLKELYTNASNQYQIYSYSGQKDESIQAMRKVAQSGFENPNSIAIAIDKTGNIIFLSSNNGQVFWSRFSDVECIDKLNADYAEDIKEGSIKFNTLDGEFSGVYKYHEDWNFYLIRAEKKSDLKAITIHVFHWTSLCIIVFTVLFIVIGYILLKKEFEPVGRFTNALINMQKKKQLEIIDLSNAPNDDITYMAASFNNLSSSVNNLLGTFQKFVSKDVVAKAYSEQKISLEGSQQELTMLFSDIKSFTYRTETLGNDIIDVLNVHYNRVIRKVHENNGVVGSIIGDAILAIYGTLNSDISKSQNAIQAAWDITRVTANLRSAMIERRTEIEQTRELTESEEKIFEAVLLDVGVGIDGGMVFYGNIGSNEHMANTVIGDNVNSASRLEGLTRVYHLPVIVSEYIKNEVEKETDRYRFFEIDTVQVKGKTEGKKVFFPYDTQEIGSEYIEGYELFEKGLAAYYEGDWKTARKYFKDAALPVTDIFIERMGLKNAPEDWSGIWTMTTK